jgi:hypothetical protein
MGPIWGQTNLAAVWYGVGWWPSPSVELALKSSGRLRCVGLRLLAYDHRLPERNSDRRERRYSGEPFGCGSPPSS